MSELRQCKRCGDIGPSHGKCGCTEPQQSDIDELRAKCERLEAALKDICEELDVTDLGDGNIAKEALSISGVCGTMYLSLDPNTIAVFKEVMGG